MISNIAIVTYKMLSHLGLSRQVVNRATAAVLQIHSADDKSDRWVIFFW